MLHCDIYGVGDDSEEIDTYIKKENPPIHLKGLSIAGVLVNYDALLCLPYFEGWRHSAC